MASANDRKISQLPVASATEDTTNFIVVSGIGTTPANERITTQTLFNNVPVSLVVGQEFAGKNVIFNATDDPTHRFTFTHDNGDVSIGSNASIGKTLTVGGDLTVSGTTTFANTNFIQLSVSGATTFNDTVVFVKKIQTNDNLIVSGDGSIGNNLLVAQNTNLNTLTVAGGTNLNNVSANTVSLSSIVATDYITVDDLNVTDITVSGNTNVDVVEATGYIRTTENVFGAVGRFDSLSINSQSRFHNKVIAEIFEAVDTVQADSLQVLSNATINNNLNVINSISANTISVSNEIQTENLVVNSGLTISGHDTSAHIENLETPIRTTVTPSASTTYGRVHIYEAGGVYYLAVNTPHGWKGYGLVDLAGTP